MAYNDLTQYPRGIYYNDLGSDRTVQAAGPIRVAWVQFANEDAASRTCLITDVDDNLIMQIVIPADDSTPALPGFYSPNGLKVAMDVNDADVTFTVVYVIPDADPS
ncbi:MAG: hypothetical protein ACYSW8_26535 [Planctomycetota bacterium]|jgi:hypothetical protein